MAADRETRVPDAAGAEMLRDPAARELFDGEAHYVEEGQELAETLQAAHSVLRFFGGTVQIAAVRVPIAPDVSPEAHVTVEYVVRWNPFDLKRPLADVPQDDAMERAREIVEEPEAVEQAA